MSADAEKEDGKESVEQSDGATESNAPEPSAEQAKDEDEAAQTPSEQSSAERAAEPEAPAAEVAPPAVHPRPQGAAWGNGFARFERALTWFESRLLFVALVALVFSLAFWVSLRGLSSPLQMSNWSGVVFRMLVGAAVLGGIARVVTVRFLKMQEIVSVLITIVGIGLGVAIAPLWRSVGIARGDAILNWLQEGTVLSMLGGLRGVSTRLTIVVAMLGASLAAARARHINIDVFLRFMRPKTRLAVHLASSAATAAVCLICAYGFFDYTSIEGFEQKSDAPMSEKIAGVRREAGHHRFAFWTQLGRDLRTMPAVVFQGERWDAPSAMSGKQWNQWIDDAGFSEHFTPEQIAQVKVPPSMESEPRVPFIMLPQGSAKNILVPDLNLLWPLGLFWIGLRIILRMILVLSGHASVDAEEDDPEENEVAVATSAATTEAAR